MNLLELQRDFIGWLGDASGEATRPLGSAAAAGLAVHQNNYRSQLVDGLSETFAKLRAWLGHAAFNEAAMAHIAQTPPHAWTLGAYGEGFDRMLAGLYPDDPEVAELAWLEWELCRAFEDTDSATLAAQELATIDWDHAELVLAPTLRIGRVTTNAGAICSALAAEQTPPAAMILPAPAAMLVWRQEFTPCFRTIEATEEEALRFIRNDASFSALCASLIEAQAESEGIARAAAFLSQWLRDGIIVGVHPRDVYRAD